MGASTDPVNLRMLRGGGADLGRTYFGVLSGPPRVGARLVLLLAPNGRLTTSRVVRVLASLDDDTIYVQTENSTYALATIASAPTRAAI